MSDTESGGLVEFLRERLAEDEHCAQQAAEQPDYLKGARLIRPGRVGADGRRFTHDERRVPPPEIVTRFGPKRVRDELDAKLRILDAHPIVWRDIGWLEDSDENYEELPACGACVPKHKHYKTRAEVPEGGCVTLRLLAVPYAGHPDYREEWKP